MTSGSFSQVLIDSITVEPRQRRAIDREPFEDLRDSIRSIGLINPIMVTRELVLVTGERRFRACKELGWTHVSAQYTDEVDPIELKAIELEENLKRVGLEWKDECRAIHEYHTLQCGRHPGWTETDTARAVSMNQSNVNRRLAAAREIIAGNAPVIRATSLSVASGMIERRNSRAASSAERTPETPEAESAVLNDDFLRWAPTYTGPRFNLIHCDFPFGIGANGFNQGAAASRGGFDDRHEGYLALLDGLERAMETVVAEEAHLVFWFSMTHYHETRGRLERMGWRLDGRPLIWVKSDNVGILPDHNRGPRWIYETAFFGTRGDRKIVRSKANACWLHTDRRERAHMSTKPVAVLSHFFEMLVDDSTRLLDPTCGSGTALAAAEALGAAHVLGLEISGEFVAIAADELRRCRISHRPVAAINRIEL